MSRARDDVNGEDAIPAISEDTRDAVIEVVWWWERYTAAKGPIDQATALSALSNAMSDMATWVPRCCEGGYFGQEHECWKEPATTDCTSCGMTNDDCITRVRSGRTGCCNDCFLRDTHNDVSRDFEPHPPRHVVPVRDGES